MAGTGGGHCGCRAGGGPEPAGGDEKLSGGRLYIQCSWRQGAVFDVADVMPVANCDMPNFKNYSHALHPPYVSAAPAESTPFQRRRTHPSALEEMEPSEKVCILKRICDSAVQWCQHSGEIMPCPANGTDWTLSQPTTI